MVDKEEWTSHTELWRQSIEADHGSPDGPGADPRYFDGTKFQPFKTLLVEELSDIVKLTEEYLELQ